MFIFLNTTQIFNNSDIRRFRVRIPGGFKPRHSTDPLAQR